MKSDLWWRFKENTKSVVNIFSYKTVCNFRTQKFMKGFRVLAYHK